mmetsp:Transcript_12835/g.23129  ORF Transcript_12835/g.23129 Transcript_12835/m.23129 type:complete len:127 (+) Transcript_12835:100-480(+)
MILGEFQSTSSIGFYFGVIVGPLLVLLSLAWMFTRGRVNNDQYKYGPASRFTKLVLLWRLCVLTFCLVALGYTFNHDSTNENGEEPESRVWGLGYFTMWSWVLVNSYFIVSLGVSLYLLLHIFLLL